MRQEFERIGNFLFRQRSYLPLLLFAVLLAGTGGFTYPQGSHRLDLAWEGLCLFVAMLGLGVRIATVGFVPQDTSGRNTRHQATESLNTTGLYSVVRHPLYVGNYLMWLGVSAFTRLWWGPVLATLVFWVYYRLIMFAEEEFLRRRFGRRYLEWAAATPMFLPRPSLWRPPDCAFSLREVLRRECSGLFALVSCFTALEMAGDYSYLGRIESDPFWTIVFSTTALAYVAVVTAKRRTQVLNGDRSSLRMRPDHRQERAVGPR